MGLLSRGTVLAWSSEELTKKIRIFLAVCGSCYIETSCVGEEVPDLQTSEYFNNISIQTLEYFPRALGKYSREYRGIFPENIEEIFQSIPTAGDPVLTRQCRNWNLVFRGCLV